MIIRGILDNSLNGQLCVRGFAPARISKSDYANDTYHEYDNKARYVTLKKIAWDNIVETLNKNFGVVTHE